MTVMIRTKTFATLLAAVLLVLAGCSAGLQGGTTASPGETTDGGFSADDSTDGSLSSALSPESGETSDSSGFVSFYVSDRPGAIEDFEHLNVTITKVGLHKAEEGDDDEEETTETQEPTETTTADANETTTDGNQTTTATNETTTDANETTTTVVETTEADEEEDEETEEEQDEEQDQEREGWVTYDVNDTTLDLTELQGANASELGVLQAPSGSYDKIFIYVSDIEATLKTGETVNVKLPSERLHVNKGFTVSENSSIDFVFDVTVFKAGNSGKYILKPVVSQTGTSDEVDIDPVDDKPPEAAENKSNGQNDEVDDDEEEDESEASENESASIDNLEAAFQGPVHANDTVTLLVRADGGPVANATVYLDDEKVGQTAADGTIEIQVPADAEEIEITIEKGDAEEEIEKKVSKGGGGQP